MARDGKSDLQDLLRHALVVAAKLKVEDFRTLIDAELNGYQGQLIEPPKYRQCVASLKLPKPYGGFTDVNFPQDAQLENQLTRIHLSMPVAQLQSILESNQPAVSIGLSAEARNALRRMCGNDDDILILQRWVHMSDVAKAIAGIRNVILEWALKLEDEGILGEGMTFSDDEKQRAAQSPGVHIQNFHGVFGNVSGQNVQIGDYGSIHQQLKDAGVSQAERNELENILDALKKAKADEKPSLVQRGMDWIGRNKEALGTLAAVIKGWFS